MTERCEDCRFFEDGTVTIGYCRRYPQVVQKNVSAWCGEFAPKPVELPKPKPVAPKRRASK